MPENKCQLGTHDCYEFAKCIDIRFSFKCECKPGLIGHRFEATPDINYRTTKNGEENNHHKYVKNNDSNNKHNSYDDNNYNNKNKTKTTTTTTSKPFDKASDLSLAFLLKEAESFAVVEDVVDGVNNKKITESFEAKGYS